MCLNLTLFLSMCVNQLMKYCKQLWLSVCQQLAVMPRKVFQENVGLELQKSNFFLCKVHSNKNAALMVHMVLKCAHGRLAKH